MFSLMWRGLIFRQRLQTMGKKLQEQQEEYTNLLKGKNSTTLEILSLTQALKVVTYFMPMKNIPKLKETYQLIN